MKNQIYMINFFLSFLFLIMGNSYGQSRVQGQTNVLELQRLSAQFHQDYTQKRATAEAWAQQRGLPIRYTCKEKVIELQQVINGCPLYYKTFNLMAARTVSTNKAWPGGTAGLNLTGLGMTIGEWDGGGVRTTHHEFGGRVIQIDVPTHIIQHATHVAGTLIAGGISLASKGMAYEANLHAYEWNNDMAEMATAAGSGLLFSNHSYGLVTGWEFDS